MITRAPGCGMAPIPSMLSGTFDSQPSSWRDNDGPSSEYHEPAWLASRPIIESAEYHEDTLDRLQTVWPEYFIMVSGINGDK